jgi:hypothetical protein
MLAHDVANNPAIEFRLSGKGLRQLPTAFPAMLEEIRIPKGRQTSRLAA